MARAFGSPDSTETDASLVGCAPATEKMDFDSEEMGCTLLREAEAFWFEVRQSVAGSPGYDADGYPLDDEGPMQRYPGVPQLSLVIDNTVRYPATWAKKKIR